MGAPVMYGGTGKLELAMGGAVNGCPTARSGGPYTGRGSEHGGAVCRDRTRKLEASWKLWKRYVLAHILRALQRTKSIVLEQLN